MIVLGLAVATSEHHAAALMVDGRYAGAVEEERLNGIKHYGWRRAGRPGANLCNTPDLRWQEVICEASVNWLLAREGLTLDDVDIVAINGIPHRYHGARQCVEEGQTVYVPHHRAHAALAARTSPHQSANVLTVDGRGEYETAAFFTYRGGELKRLAEVPVGEGCSIGGVYDTMTRALGFGPHGQGQTMALAAFAQGEPGRLSKILSARSFDDLQVDERAAQSYAQAWLRSGVGDETSRRAGLAADLQCSLEDVLVALALDGQSRAPCKHWAVAGGVALNCRANQRIADAVGGRVWVPSAPHDAGTALGAALEAMAVRGETLPGPLLHAGLGPAFSTAQCAEALKQVGLWDVAYEASVQDAAQCLARGGVMGWFDGPLEFGPRALGHRSIVAHPGLSGVAERVNHMKERQRWRPFGPSVLAGEASAYFETDGFGPFMTRAVSVKHQCHDQVREVVHVDGTTRPQSVGRDAPEPYRALIEAFHGLTDIPMVLNTSFNRRGKPIVCNPDDAIATAVAMGLDALWMAGVIVPLSALGRQ